MTNPLHYPVLFPFPLLFPERCDTMSTRGRPSAPDLCALALMYLCYLVGRSLVAVFSIDTTHWIYETDCKGIPIEVYPKGRRITNIWTFLGEHRTVDYLQSQVQLGFITQQESTLCHGLLGAQVAKNDILQILHDWKADEK